VTTIVTNPPYGRRLFEFVDRALELTRLVGGTVAILINTQWQTGAANSIRLRHPAFQASVMLTNRIAWSRTPGLARLMFAGKDAETEPEARCCIVCLPYAASVHGSCRCPAVFGNVPSAAAWPSAARPENSRSDREGLLEVVGLVPPQSPRLQPLTPVRAHLRHGMTSSSYAGNPRFA
jgi:hypothetical protein